MVFTLQILIEQKLNMGTTLSKKNILKSTLLEPKILFKLYAKELGQSI